jgi:hypothetical protein
VNLTIGSVPSTLSPYFWGTTISARAPLFPDEGAIVNATPTNMIVFPGGSTGDTYNPLNDTIIHPAKKNSTWSKPATSEAEFVSWCKSIKCSAIFQVPGEIDNISIAKQVVNYTEKTLGFHPAYWEVGNEPEFWKEWKIPWTSWGAKTNPKAQRITPAEYASEVHNYTLALRTIDPTIQILGIAASGRVHNKIALTDWLNATVDENAGLISGVAIHVYANGKVGPYTLQNFYGGVNGVWDLRNDAIHSERAISAQLNTTCPSCAPIPVFVTEIGSAISFQGYANFSREFPGALGTAAMELEGIEMNLPNVDIFAGVMGTTNSWINFKEQFRPDYTMYAQMLSHLGTIMYPVSLQTPSAPVYHLGNDSLSPNLMGVATIDPAKSSRSDLFLMNLNMTTNVSLVPSLVGVSRTSPTELWTWSGKTIYTASNQTTWEVPATNEPVPYFFPNGLPANWTLPAQTAALFEAYPQEGNPVTFQESGLPTNTRWYVTVDGMQLESTQTNVTAFLPSGTYALNATPLNLPLNKTVAKPKERYAPFPPAFVTVTNAPQTIPVPYRLQYAINLTVSPAGYGSIVPFSKWANASAPLTLQAKPGPGYAFSRWAGWGKGSLNSTKSTITITPLASLREKAVFVVGYEITFNESGLPAGTNWSITIRGVTNSSNTPIINFIEKKGKYGFKVGAVTGYQSKPTDSWINVTDIPLRVSISFSILRPPPPTFLVQFVESGLPLGTNWSVTIRHITRTSSNATIQFHEANGTYGFNITQVPGYHANRPAGGFTVKGAIVSIPIDFLPGSARAYTVIWKEKGLWSGISWWVLVEGAQIVATGSRSIAYLENGSYTYHIGDVSDFSPTPLVGEVNVAGASQTIPVIFARALFPIVVTASGLPSNLAWRLRVSVITLNLTTNSADIPEPNGTYSWDVVSPSGYHPNISHGNLTVNASSVNLNIRFIMNGPGPGPSVGYLVSRAILVGGGMLMGVEIGLLIAGRAFRSRPPTRYVERGGLQPPAYPPQNPNVAYRSQ